MDKRADYTKTMKDVKQIKMSYDDELEIVSPKGTILFICISSKGEIATQRY